MPVSPIIITGMHRSGTSLVTRMLEKFGLFVGDMKEGNQEAVFFLSVNNWLLGQANATWDNVDNLDYIDTSLELDMVNAARHILHGPDRKLFLGADKFNRYAGLDGLDIPWGWKDPRNILFINVWKNIFPQARILNIYRNPVDVAASLKRRSDAYRERVREVIETRGIAELLGQNPRLQVSARVADINGGISLWEDYNRRAIAAEDRYGNEVLSLRYEDLLESPADVLEGLCAFLGLEPGADTIQQQIKGLESNRRYAFARDKELAVVNRALRDNSTVQRLGYASIGED